MHYHAPSRCPVCGHTMEITRLHCETCNTELTGKFTPCRFCMLEEKHLQFVEVFLRCRGSIKEVEKALGVSYPTVRNMMDAALTALGFDEKTEPAADPNEEKRQAILARLSSHEIDVETAVQQLSGLKEEMNDEQ
ncbi:DUF2089 domain-containing protein [Candidatus Soleaferrea massiliensis]|uniref:DUF2089 domain-containing protein n=1 Tax=Candidatus Soleaferrea massiliensis TaxID=1470354 RepID=UPI00058D7433|nr:DUF2089 domain-containing protein [Candidatus Soleaferrea massiliensis]